MFTLEADSMLNAFFGGGISALGGGLGGGMRESGERLREKLDFRRTISVTLEELYNGTTLTIDRKRRIICTECGGHGLRRRTKLGTRCPGCRGSGARVIVRQMGMLSQQLQTVCEACNGSGERIDPADRCRKCAGEKTVEVAAPIAVVVTPGMRHNECIQYSGLGNEHPECATVGDAVIQIAQKPHARFTRSGDNLHFTQPITLAEALCGFQFKLLHLDGRELLVRRKRGEITQPGEQRCVYNEGMPTARGNKFGDLYIHFNVHYPVHVDENQMKILRETLPPPKATAANALGQGNVEGAEVCRAFREEMDVLRNEISRDEEANEDYNSHRTAARGCQAQ